MYFIGNKERVIAKDSYIYKDNLKALGWKWDNISKVWYASTITVLSNTRKVFPEVTSAGLDYIRLNNISVGNNLKTWNSLTPDNLKIDNLDSHQNAAVEQLLKRKTNIILGDEAGVGKGVTLAAYLNEVFKDNTNSNFTIVCPNHLVGTWHAEMRKWAPGVPYRLVRAQELSSKKFVPINTDVLIVDEAHMYKNKTLRSKNIESIDASKIILATGTAFTNHPAEIWRLLELIKLTKFFGSSKSDFYKNYRLAYLEEFFIAGGRGTTQTAWKLNSNVDTEALESLSKDLHKICYIRRDKKDCVDLPAVREENAYIDILTQKQKDKAEHVFNEWAVNRKKDDSIFKLRADDAFRKVSHKDFKEYYINALESMQGPVVVFAHHQKVIKRLVELSSEYAIGVLDGNTSQDDRDNLVIDFQAGKLDILICSIPVASTGITLIKSSNMIIVELPWTYADLDQMISRINRRGQENKCYVSNIMLKGSFDDYMYSLVLNKKHFQNVLTSENNFITNQGE